MLRAAPGLRLRGVAAGAGLGPDEAALRLGARQSRRCEGEQCEEKPVAPADHAPQATTIGLAAKRTGRRGRRDGLAWPRRFGLLQQGGAGVVQMVERQLPKLYVEGSIPFTRSNAQAPIGLARVPAIGVATLTASITLAPPRQHGPAPSGFRGNRPQRQQWLRA